MHEYRTRTQLFVSVIIVVLCILGLRLGWLQIVDAEAYTGESRTAIREQRVRPSRGVIYDRNGVLMVDNAPAYIIRMTPYYMNLERDGELDAERVRLLATLLEVPDSLVVARYQEAKAWSSLKPSASFREVPFETFSRVLENSHLLPGVTYEVAHKRRYLTDARAAHSLGYIREITRAELDNRADQGYRSGDLIGKAGIERGYEAELRGELGRAFKFVNRYGQEIESYQGGAEDIPPVSGYDLHLTIDSKVQALAESLFVGKRGAAVAINPKTGGLIALVSHPDFDPELFSKPVSPEMWRYLTQSEDKPQFNRATMSGLMPGSTWKPFMALMALEEGIITEDTHLYCPGYYMLGGRPFRCHGGAHGSIPVRTAIQKSCNTFFFTVMMRTDVNTFHKWATRFGFGQRIPVDIAEQNAGLIPDSAYYNRTYPRGWTPGYSINLGIGQGDMLVTPIQLARYIAAVANGGTLQVPHLVAELRHPETDAVKVPERPEAYQIPIAPQHFETVRQGMRLVMEQGTGRGAQVPGFTGGGKTGTAQNPHGKDHSLFVYFGPYEDSEIAVAVFVENGGFGATQAAPIASLMAEQYLTGQISEARRYLIQRIRTLSSAEISL